MHGIPLPDFMAHNVAFEQKISGHFYKPVYYYINNLIQFIPNIDFTMMYYYSMDFKLNDTVPDVQDDHPLQNISS